MSIIRDCIDIKTDKDMITDKDYLLDILDWLDWLFIMLLVVEVFINNSRLLK